MEKDLDEKITLLFIETGLLIFELEKSKISDSFIAKRKIMACKIDPVDDRTLTKSVMVDKNLIKEPINPERVKEIILMFLGEEEDRKLAETWILGGYLNQ